MMLPEPNIILAVKNNDLPWLRRLLGDKNVDVDEDDIGGWTALHQAADHQNAEAAMLLLQHHADPTLENGMGLTARDSARIQFDKHGDFEVLRAVDAMCPALARTTPLCSFHTAPAQSGFMLAKRWLAFQKRATC